MATIWEHFESLIVEYLESRIAEILTQGDVAPSPKLIANVREAAERAVARFQANNGVETLGKRRINS
jgi:hypothetical protein